MKTRVSVEKKLDLIIEHLTDVVDGGYPGESLWIGDTLAYTSANSGEKYGSQLGSITREAMLAWYDRAATFLEDNPDFGGDVSSALSETEAAE
jgi:hypothetical protein